ncbi:MAG: trigger factor [Methylocystaceae bacterium]
MKTTVETIEKNKVAMEVVIDQERLDRSLDHAYRKLAGKVNIPGFRKGKAPRPIVESFIGYEALLEEALEEVVNDTYSEAIKENDIEPVAQPHIDLVSTEKGQPVVYKATIVTRPEVELGAYTEIAVSVPTMDVTENDIENRLNLMRNRYAQLETVDADIPAEMGNTLLIDFTGSLEGVPFPGGSAEDYSLELGSGRFIPGFEEQLVGAKTGEDVQVNVTFPADYHSADLAGKEAVFAVKVKEIKRKVLAELSDEFAQEVSDYDTLDELKESIKKSMEEMAVVRRKQLATTSVEDQVIANASVDIPEEMVQNRTYQMIEQMGERLAYQGLSLEEYMKSTETSWEDLESEFKADAEKLVRRELVLLAVAKAEGLTVDEEDFEESMSKAAADYGVSVEEVKKSVASSRKRIEEGILLDKAAEFLYEKAQVTVENTAE